MLLIFKMPARDTTSWLDVKGRRPLHGRSCTSFLTFVILIINHSGASSVSSGSSRAHLTPEVTSAYLLAAHSNITWSACSTATQHSFGSVCDPMLLAKSEKLKRMRSRHGKAARDLSFGDSLLSASTSRPFVAVSSV